MAGAVAADAGISRATTTQPRPPWWRAGADLSVGYVYAWNHLSTNGQDSGVADVHGLVGGLAIPGKLFGIPFAFRGGALHAGRGASHIQALRQETPRWAGYDGRASIVFLAANLGGPAVPLAGGGRGGDLPRGHQGDVRHLGLGGHHQPLRLQAAARGQRGSLGGALSPGGGAHLHPRLRQGGAGVPGADQIDLQLEPSAPPGDESSAA